MTTPARQPQQDYLSITSEELLIIEHGCIYPDKDECIGKHCKYHDPNPSFRDNIVCLLNEHDVADRVRSRPHTSPPAQGQGTSKLCFGTQHPASERCQQCNELETCKQKQRYLEFDKQQVAKAEREQVLDEIIAFGNEQLLDVSKTSNGNGALLRRLQIGLFKAKAESLRAQQEHPITKGGDR